MHYYLQVLHTLTLDLHADNLFTGYCADCRSQGKVGRVQRGQPLTTEAPSYSYKNFSDAKFLKCPKFCGIQV